MPSPGDNGAEHAADDIHAHPSPARLGWACLLKRVFDIDLEHCPEYGGALKILAAIEDPAVITKILTQLRLPARAPPRSPARPVALFQKPPDPQPTPVQQLRRRSRSSCRSHERPKRREISPRRLMNDPKNPAEGRVFTRPIDDD